MSVSLEKFGEYFHEKRHGTYKCMFCGEEKFSSNTIASVDMALQVIPSGINPDSTGPSGHAYYSISCTNCGNTTFFNAIQVNNWLSKRAKEGGSE